MPTALRSYCLLVKAQGLAVRKHKAAAISGRYLLVERQMNKNVSVIASFCDVCRRGKLSLEGFPCQCTFYPIVIAEPLHLILDLTWPPAEQRGSIPSCPCPHAPAGGSDKETCRSYSGRGNPCADERWDRSAFVRGSGADSGCREGRLH